MNLTQALRFNIIQFFLKYKKVELENFEEEFKRDIKYNPDGYLLRYEENISIGLRDLFSLDKLMFDGKFIVFKN